MPSDQEAQIGDQQIATLEPTVSSEPTLSSSEQAAPPEQIASTEQSIPGNQTIPTEQITPSKQAQASDQTLPSDQTASSGQTTAFERVDECDKIEIESKAAIEETQTPCEQIEEVEIIDQDSNTVSGQEKSSMNDDNSKQKSSEESKTSEDNAIVEPSQQHDVIRAKVEPNDCSKQKLDESVQIKEDPPLFFESKSPNRSDRTPSYGSIIQWSPSPPRTPTKAPPEFYESKSSRRGGYSPDPRSRSPSPPRTPSRASSEFYGSRIPYRSGHSPDHRSRSSSDYRSRSRASPSPLPLRSPSKSKVVCRYFIRKSGCMRGDQCAFMHPGAIKGPELEFCPEYQRGECHQRNCDLVHASRQEQWHYLNTGILPPGLRISERFTTWSSFDTTRQQRSNNKVVPISDLGSSNSRSPRDRRSLTGWWDDRKCEPADSERSDVVNETLGAVNKQEPINDERFERKGDNQSESSYYESSGGEGHSPRLSKHILKIKQVPLDAGMKDIEEFLQGYRYKENSIHQHKIDGSSIGVFYIQFDTNADLLRVLDKNSKRLHPLDKRSVEVVRADVDELKVALEDSNIVEIGTTEFVRIKGVPEDSTERDVAAFFEGLHIAKDGIVLPLDYRYKRTPNCFVQFESVEDAEKALQKDGQLFEFREVKVMKSSKTQFQSQVSELSKQKLIRGDQRPLREAGKGSRSRSRSRRSERSDDDRSTKPNRSGLDSIFPYYFNQDPNAAENSANPAKIERRSKQSHLSKHTVPNRRLPNPPRYYHPASSPRSSFGKDHRPPSRPYHRRYADRPYHDRPYADRPYYERPYAERPCTPERSRRTFSPHSYRAGSRHSASPTHRENYRRSMSPEKMKGQFFYESFYNKDQDQNDLYKRIVKVKNLPCNTTKEDLLKFFEQLKLVPKNIQIFIDRVRKITEADVEFSTLSDAKKSFILGGARLRTQFGGYCRHVEIFIHPELASVNVINPLSNSITTKYSRERSVFRPLSEQIFPFETDSPSSHRHLDENQPEQRYCETDDEKSQAKHQKGGDLLNNFLTNQVTNSILIDQLKNSIMQDIRKQERLNPNEASDYEKERSACKRKHSSRDYSSREKHASSRGHHKSRLYKYSDSESSESHSSSEREVSKKERSSSHRKHEKSHKHRTSRHKSSHHSRKRSDDGESSPKKRRS